MTVRELLESFPRGALVDLVNWLEWQGRVLESRDGWRKEDYVDVVQTRIARADAIRLRDGLRRITPHFPDALLAQVFGLPSKEIMLAGLNLKQLRKLMDEVDDGGIEFRWRSSSADKIRDHIARRFRADEIAKLVGIAFRSRSERARPSPQKERGPVVRAELTQPNTDAHHATELDPSPEGPAAIASADRPVRLIERLDELHAYLLTDLQQDLAALQHLGENEQRFQHHIVTVLERRISLESFRIEEKWHLPETDQFADVVIHHAHGNTAIEIKPDGQLEKLLADAAKLRGYLQARKTRVTLGVLIYRSPRSVPSKLSRAMTGERLHLVRVPQPRR